MNSDKYLNLLNPSQIEVLNAANIFKANGCMFQYLEEDHNDGKTIKVNGKRLLHFGSCSYMGLETHPDLINSAIEAVKQYGTQTPSSRASLSSPLYKDAEELLVQIFPGHHIITQTVTLGHLAVLPLLIQEKDAIIIDAYAHNSIRMACQLCLANGTFIILSKHNDMDHVRYLVNRLKKDGYRNIWYCADSIYSMHGDFIDIHGLMEIVKNEEKFYAYVDDAHGTGWYGEKGRGFVFENIEIHERLIVIESLAKSIAACGAVIVVKDEELSNIIRQTGQTMLFSGPIQPPTLGALIGSLKVHLSQDFKTMQQELKNLIIHFRKKSKELGLPIVTKDNSPIQFLKIGDVDKNIIALEKLLFKGFFTIPAVYPAVSIENSGIRITLTRHLTKKDIDNLLLNVKDILIEFNE